MKFTYRYTIPLLLAASASLSNAFSSTNFTPKSTIPSALFMDMAPPIRDVKEEFKTSALNTMLQWSALTYSYTALRGIINKNDATLNPDKEGAVAFKNPELVVTQHLEETNPFKGTHLKQTLTPTDILKFIELNQKYLVGDEGALEFNPDGDGDADYDGDGKADLPIMKRLAQLDDEFEAEMIEYDDEFKSAGLGSELVFATIINKTEKRITVVFRGSVTLKDWIVDLSGVKKTPEIIEEFSSKDVDIHCGFAGYLFGESNEEGKTKFDQILYILKQACSSYKDYDIYITGHSLGGALTQLLAFALAGSSEAADLPKPINAISYASPRVGDSAFLKKYQELEKDGKLRHVRVSNQGDIVAVAPSLGYCQTGVNLHVRENKEMVRGYSTDRSILGQLNLKALDMHNLDVYHERLFTNENSEDLCLDVAGLYEKYAGIKA